MASYSQMLIIPSASSERCSYLFLFNVSVDVNDLNPVPNWLEDVHDFIGRHDEYRPRKIDFELQIVVHEVVVFLRIQNLHERVIWVSATVPQE